MTTLRISAASLPTDWGATLLSGLVGAMIGAVVGGIVALIIARSVATRAERQLALETASLEGAKVMAGELRELLKCASVIHRKYDEEHNWVMRFRVDDVETAAVLQAPSLPRSLQEEVSNAVAGGQIYVERRQELTNELVGGVRSRSEVESLDREEIRILKSTIDTAIDIVNAYRTPPANGFFNLDRRTRARLALGEKPVVSTTPSKISI